MSENNYDNLKKSIRGPVFPIVVPFRENQDLDLDSLHRYVDFLAKEGAPVLLVTVGTSRFNLLSRDEMKAVNQVVAEAAAGRSLTIVAGPGPISGSTRENIEFAKYAERIGADAILILYPERWYGDEPVIEFFHEVASNTTLGVVVHALPMRDGFGGVTSLRYLTADLLEKITSKENIIGIKEESGNREIFERILARLNRRTPVIGAGGAMRRFINDYKLGSITYLVGIGSIRPDLALDFYDAVINGEEAVAESIAAKYEDAYFSFAVESGWHPTLKESLSLMGLLPPYERSPLQRIPVGRRKLLAQLMKDLCWLK